MKGLLYKDFVSMKGKKWCLIFIGIFIAFVIIRIMLPGTDTGFTYSILNDDGTWGGSLGEVYDAVLSLLLLTSIFSILWGYTKVINTFTMDEKTNDRSFLLSLPCSRESYVASKYVLLIIVLYFTNAFCMLMSMAYAAFCSMADNIMDVYTMDSLLALAIPIFIMLTSALSFPVYIIKGTKKASAVNTYFYLCITFISLGIIFFVPPSVIAEANFVQLIVDHVGLVLFIETIMNILVYVFLYISYRYTVKHYVPNNHTGWEDDVNE